MPKTFLQLSALLFAWLVASDAFGQMLASPVQVSGGRNFAAGALAISSIEYDFDSNYDEDIDRRILGGEFALGVTPTVDVFFQAGYIVDSEIDGPSFRDIEGDGGFVIGAGARPSSMTGGRAGARLRPPQPPE